MINRMDMRSPLKALMLEQCYDRYKKQFLLNCEHSLDDLLSLLVNKAKNLDGMWYESSKDVITEWENSIDGEIYVTIDEFEATIFNDEFQMRSLLDNDDFKLWKEFTQ